MGDFGGCLVINEIRDYLCCRVRQKVFAFVFLAHGRFAAARVGTIAWGVSGNPAKVAVQVHWLVKRIFSGCIDVRCIPAVACAYDDVADAGLSIL